MLEDAGAALDDGMIYWDVRPSNKFPTVEVRVSDVPATVAETVLFATLVRAAVMTATEAEKNGEPVVPLTDYVLKAAYWKSARDGLDGRTIDLAESHAVAPTVELLTNFVEHLRPALEQLGEYDTVRGELARVIETGNGAMRQRRAFERRREAADVIDELAAATIAE